MKLADHIQRYIELAARADRIFREVTSSHEDLMPCKQGCDDCCKVYFELSLIEAFYVSGMFHEKMGKQARERALIRADEAEPLFRQAKQALTALQSKSQGSTHAPDAAEVASRLRIRCPLLEDGGCVLYNDRPITCRLYGCPQKIGARIVTCPRTGFTKGMAYATIDVDEIQHMLGDYSKEFLHDILGVKSSIEAEPRFTMPQTIRTIFDKDYFTRLKRGIP